MMNWAVGREYLERSPFRQGTQALITFEREDNRRTQRVLPKEEEVLLGAANPQMQMLIIMALDAGLRRRELLKLSCGDTDLTQQLIHIGLDPVS